jgi:hypothetical protein
MPLYNRIETRGMLPFDCQCVLCTVVPFAQRFSLLDACLRQTYADIEPVLRNDFYTLDVCQTSTTVHELVADASCWLVACVFQVCKGSVFVFAESPTIVVLEWSSNAVNDMLADSILAIMLQIEANPATNYIGVYTTHTHTHTEREREREMRDCQ